MLRAMARRRAKAVSNSAFVGMGDRMAALFTSGGFLVEGSEHCGANKCAGALASGRQLSVETNLVSAIQAT